MDVDGPRGLYLGAVSAVRHLWPRATAPSERARKARGSPKCTPRRPTVLEGKTAASPMVAEGRVAGPCGRWLLQAAQKCIRPNFPRPYGSLAVPLSRVGLPSSPVVVELRIVGRWTAVAFHRHCVRKPSIFEVFSCFQHCLCVDDAGGGGC